MEKRQWRFFALHWENGPEVCNTFEFGTDEDKKKLNLVLKKFEDYRSPRKNTSFERFRYWNRSQQEGETVNQFVTVLKRRIKNCEYTPSTDTIVRDHLVFGIRDAKVQGQLLSIHVEKLTLEKALSHYLSAEVTNAKLKEIRSPPEEKEVLVVSTHPKQEKAKPNSDGSAFNCSRCGTKHLPRQCPYP